MSTRPIPEGYHSLQPYLTVRGAAKALDFYKDLFDAVELVRMTQPGGDTLMHGELRIGDSILMISDEAEAMNVYSPLKYGGSPVSLMHYVQDVDATYRKAMAVGCHSLMPPTDMFWGDRFCRFTDPYGHVWGVATHKFDPTPEQIEAGAKACAP